MSQFPTDLPPHLRTSLMQPHRGVTILVLGILGLTVCFIMGIVAWVMANSDLREMDAGRMDAAGRDLTRGGKICGMVASFLGCIAVVIWSVWIVVAVAS